ncbi:hypothetical protein [Krasilnikovia sp. M28-CT-15]|uniref:hypothetical protein n=1 Tax=Krasilnikovia sp. M28-CT-15 TaxID=3373540 RepID=UPI0038773428
MDEPKADDQPDALMYAISGEPVPAARAREPEFAREHARAEATVTALRRGLTQLGDDLAETPSPSPAVARPRVPDAGRRWWARPMPVAAGVLVVAALAVGVGVLRASPPDSDDAGTASRSLPGVVACADTIAIGTVTRVHQQDGRWQVTLGVQRYLKPERGPQTLTVTAANAGPAPDGWQTGQRTLVVVHEPKAGVVDGFTGADIDQEWAWMSRVLPGSRSIDPRNCDPSD